MSCLQLWAHALHMVRSTADPSSHTHMHWTRALDKSLLDNYALSRIKSETRILLGRRLPSRGARALCNCGASPRKRRVQKGCRASQAMHVPTGIKFGNQRLGPAKMAFREILLNPFPLSSMQTACPRCFAR